MIQQKVLMAWHPTLYFCYKSKPLFNTLQGGISFNTGGFDVDVEIEPRKTSVPSYVNNIEMDFFLIYFPVN